MRAGVRIGIDVGKARVGVARSDSAGLMAVPVATYARENALSELSRLATEHSALEFVCGLPLSLSGGETQSTSDAREFANELFRLTAVPVRLVDERLSTVSAQHALHAAQHSEKSGRGVIDQVAATMILESALDAERSGVKLGETVGEQ